MLDKFLVLLERFVVAHELIAANSARKPVGVNIKQVIEDGLKDGGEIKAAIVGDKELPVEGEEIIDTPKKTRKEQLGEAFKANPAAKPEPEDDLADDEEPEEKPVRKAKAKPAPKEEPAVDIAAIREDIKTIAKHIAAGESDQCADLFDELLEEYKVRTVTKLPDDVVEAFFKDAKTLVAKYYDLED